MNTIKKIFDIKNKNIVLTGASGTLGTEYSNFLSSAGAYLILIDLNIQEPRLLILTLRQRRMSVW